MTCTTATGATAQHAYDWAGTYAVKLAVNDDDGAVATTTRPVVVRDEAAAGQQRVVAAKDGVRCSSSAWALTVTKAGASAPARSAVTWADGSRALVPLASSTAGDGDVPDLRAPPVRADRREGRRAAGVDGEVRARVRAVLREALGTPR